MRFGRCGDGVERRWLGAVQSFALEIKRLQRYAAKAWERGWGVAAKQSTRTPGRCVRQDVLAVVVAAVHSEASMRGDSGARYGCMRFWGSSCCHARLSIGDISNRETQSHVSQR